MSGASTPSRSSRSLMRGTDAAASARSTVMRTSSEPARAKATTWATVASTSAVSVLVIDCTTIGASPPTVTLPILTGIARRRAFVSMRLGYIIFGGAAPAGRMSGFWPACGLPPKRHDEVGKERRRGDARRGEQRGYGIGHAIGRQRLQALQENGDREEHGRHRHRPARGNREHEGEREIGKEVLQEPMQPESHLPRRRNERRNDDRREQHDPGEAG